MSDEARAAAGTLILGLGNELIGDDAVGVRVARTLGRLALPEGVAVEARPALGLELVELLGAWERIVIVDAMRTGRPPGTCTTLEIEELAALAQRPSCSHSFGVVELLALARRLAPEASAAKLTIIGVEARAMDRFGTALSDEVRAALPVAVDAVLARIGAPEALRAEAREHARALADWVPSAAEV